MPRPKVPLISRRGVAEAALQLIDEKGLEAFNIRKLGEMLGVNGASLYHPYNSKAEIFEDVARLVLGGVELLG